ncbi:peptide transporter [Mycoplasma enhydrae]|uniref:protein translocase subunit SecDF n=1 Tax=Mycoplasma enhydrae TaxID=2499220 RepID=UPI00197BF50D|nr:peptide transporter [Mycoplasma enhydrae]MBN4089500.1 peptide transporter [Mycoplasma enhydrae]MCV3733655.1 peptide transporter [Mycoplasma enhydrae]MCV3753364.1 peptide transporter [Mycoplasma enhydrae]
MNKKIRISPALKWAFSIFIIFAMLISLIFGSIFYLGPNIKKSNIVNNQIVGSKVTLRIDEDKNLVSPKEKLQPSQIANIVKNYLQEKNDKLTSNFDVGLLSSDLLEVKSLLATNDKLQQELISSLTKKPYLTITDHKGQPLFYKGQYQGQGATSHGLDELIAEGAQNFNMDLDANPAISKIPQGYADRIQIKLNDYAWDQFTRLAFDYWLKSFQQGQGGPTLSQNKIYFWLNIDEFIHNAQTNDKEGWEKAGKNPVKYAYVNNNPDVEEKKDKKGNVISSIDPILKNSITAQKYLISATSPISLISSQKRDSVFYLINNSPNGYSNSQLASLINFSYTPFTLTKQFSYYELKPVYKFDSFVLAIVILYTTLALYLIIKHRMMGAISSIAMAFLLFVFLSIITAFGLAINSLVVISIMLIMFVAFNIIAKKLQIFSKEMLEGANPNKAINRATKKTFISGLDVVAIMGLGAIITYYLNVNHSSTIGALVGIGVLLIGLILIGLNTIVLRALIQTESFDKKTNWLLTKKVPKCKLLAKIEVLFKAKYFIIPVIVFLVVGIIVYGSFAIKENHGFAGLNVNSEIYNNHIYSIGINLKNESNLETHQKILLDLNSYITSNHPEALVKLTLNSEKGFNEIIVNSKVNLNDFMDTNLVGYFNSKGYTDVELVRSANVLGATNIGYAIGWNTLLLVLITISSIIYLSFRYSFQAAFIFFIKQILLIGILLASFAIFRTKMNVQAYDSLVLISFINIFDSAINASRIKAETKKDLNTKNYIYTPEQVHTIFKVLLTDTLPIQRINMLIAIGFMISAPFLLVTISFSAIMAIGVGFIALWYLNLFIMPKIWESLTNLKYANKLKRIQNDFWNTEKIQEQTFIGINDFSI